MPAFQSIPEFDLSAKYQLKAVGCEQQAEHATDPTTEQVWRQSVRSVVGQKRKCPGSRGTSVLPSGADIVSLPQYVRLVPRPASCTAAGNSFIRSLHRRER